MHRKWDPYRDRQQDPPRFYCALCGGEEYGADSSGRKGVCSECRERDRKRRDWEMTMKEMSVEYRAQVSAIRTRIRELEAALEASRDEKERSQLENRIWILTAIWRDTRDQAVLLERYYERGYRRNARYTL